jgi:hypothetical protein
MNISEVKKLLRVLVDREFQKNKQGFMIKLKGIDELNDNDTLDTLIDSLDMRNFFDEINIDKTNETLKENMNVWVRNLRGEIL